MKFAITTFISAFLLFQVQPMLAKYILPWFGGSPTVWSTCMLFFQFGLLIGYSYAHILSKFFDSKKQVIIHFTILIISLLLMPITPSESLKPDSVSSPIWDIIILLGSTVGFPYVMVSSTGPLLQHWFSKKFTDKSPYRLYALSNLGSLLGLLSYPFLFEPNFGLYSQTIGWSIGYGVFILFCGWSGIELYKTVQNVSEKIKLETKDNSNPIGFIKPILWLCLSAIGSILLLATTNFVCQDVAVIPFLWIVPLALYLITFIIAFDSPRWYIRWIWMPLLFVAVCGVFYLLVEKPEFEGTKIVELLVMYFGAMFVATLVCHGEMVRLKPSSKHLTFFYIMVSLGGALGGCFVTFVAPELFVGFWEFPIAFVLTLIFSAIAFILSPGAKTPKWIPYTVGAIMFTSAMYFNYHILHFVSDFKDNVLESRRNFYGVLRVLETDKESPSHYYKLYHGRINHGMQFRDSVSQQWSTSYFSPHSGIGIALRMHHKKEKQKAGINEGMNVGMIGMGTGTVATYCTPLDKHTYYEINPEVDYLAKKYFTYLSNAGDNVNVVLGDGRIELERAFRTSGSKKFDVLAVDAFSGDAIPIHLLTKEAFQLYFNHLNEDGILAIHISNLYFELEPLVYNMAGVFQTHIAKFKNKKDRSLGIKSATWILLTKNRAFMEHPRVKKHFAEWDEGVGTNPVIWTDDYSDVITLLKKI